MELALPIKFYQQPRMLVFFAILCMIGLVFFSYDLIYPIDTHRGELPILIKIIIIIFCIGWDAILLKQLIDKKPLFTLNKQHISITQWFKEDIIIAYQDIEAIHISHNRHPRIVFERHNSKLYQTQQLQYCPFSSRQGFNGIHLFSKVTPSLTGGIYNSFVTLETTI